MIASRDDPLLRRSVIGLAVEHRDRRRARWSRRRSSTAARRPLCGSWRSLLDCGGRYLFGAEGWKLVPRHFAERHGLIVIIALGESIVAHRRRRRSVASTLGVVAAADARDRSRGRALVGLLRRRRARRGAAPRRGCATGREQNEVARDSYSYLHLPMVAGIVLLALGMKKTLAHVERPARDGARGRPRRRRGDLPPRARRLPLAQLHTLGGHG